MNYLGDFAWTHGHLTAELRSLARRMVARDNKLGLYRQCVGAGKTENVAARVAIGIISFYEPSCRPPIEIPATNGALQTIVFSETSFRRYLRAQIQQCSRA